MYNKVYAMPTNAGGLIGYSLYSGCLKYPKQLLKTWRPRSTTVSIDMVVLLCKCTRKPANQDS